MTEQLDTVAAAQNRQLHQAVRNLATQISKVSKTARSSSVRKATVVAVNYNKSTGLVTADLNLSGDTTVTVPAVSVVQGVSPNVGDTVNVLKQDATMSVVSQISTQTGTNPPGGWIQASLASGFSHNGDSQGNLYYRIVNDNGAMRMDWMGAVGITGTPTSVLSAALDTDYRPSSQRKLILPRGLGNGASFLDVQVQFTTSGTVVLQGAQPTAPSHTHSLGTSGAGGDVHDHSHGGAVGEVSFVETHTHAMGSSTGTSGSLPAPDWVSFNGAFYYL